MENKKFDWIIVGGGAAGISIGEMLARLGYEILIIEKNSKLAGETSGYFHEWLHTGSLYTLTPDKLETTKYLLGALDDLLIYYSCFSKMNICPTSQGLKIGSEGWFNNDNILYKYKSRPFNPIWSFVSARSISLVEAIKNHDWLRKRAGSMFETIDNLLIKTLKNYPMKFNEFIKIESPDLTINSRMLLTDLLNEYEENNGLVMTNTEAMKIADNAKSVEVFTNRGVYKANNVVLCCADRISRFTKTKLKTSYAPMFVVESGNESVNSFVELDIFTKNCINMIKKTKSVGLAGGISVNKKSELNSYSEFCVKSHLKLDPSLKFIDQYIGVKKELVTDGNNRNYLFHIDNLSPRIWSVVLGKFTLMFSLAPEFVRRVYNKNFIPNHINRQHSDFALHSKISETDWKKIIS